MNACVLSEMLVLHHARVIIAHSSLVAMPSTRGNPVAGITPPSFACSAHPHFLLHRHLDELSDHRNVAVASFSFRHRGTLFVPPW